MVKKVKRTLTTKMTVLLLTTREDLFNVEKGNIYSKIQLFKKPKIFLVLTLTMASFKKNMIKNTRKTKTRMRKMNMQKKMILIDLEKLKSLLEGKALKRAFSKFMSLKN